VPYDRTLLSKALPNGDASKFGLRDDDFLKKADIDYVLGDRAFSVKPEERKVITNGGKKLIYDKLMIATGSSAWKPPIKGIDL